MPAESFWTEDRLALLAEIHTLGSNSWIAREINERTGSRFTRNAIIGKRHRLELASPASQGRCHGAQIKRKKRAPRRVYWDRTAREKKPLPLEADPPEFLGLTIFEINKTTCRYPKGDGTAESPFLFCGGPALEGSSYCAHCHAICWRPAPTKKKISANDRIWGYAA